MAGTVVASTGEIRVNGKVVDSWSPRAALANRIGRIPEDRHACLIADESRQAELAARVTEMFRSAHAPLTTRLFARDELRSLQPAASS